MRFHIILANIPQWLGALIWQKNRQPQIAKHRDSLPRCLNSMHIKFGTNWKLRNTKRLRSLMWILNTLEFILCGLKTR